MRIVAVEEQLFALFEAKSAPPATGSRGLAGYRQSSLRDLATVEVRPIESTKSDADIVAAAAEGASDDGEAEAADAARAEAERLEAEKKKAAAAAKAARRFEPRVREEVALGSVGSFEGFDWRYLERESGLGALDRGEYQDAAE